ncbi:hypothetical protein CLOSTASPAR_00239 [[Clostridium] asparagiforme DSM 15981]|uniref:Uncharacterized protein n=1 Tax=[Clostridium] asparagiforme DSM 15981 TaxID=518636 RepID=C0CTE1_9FIRM|nr:hypothetical protein CLOSTASPAR_00239 [[Clostridium] asparagiforme DSM 15981]
MGCKQYFSHSGSLLSILCIYISECILNLAEISFPVNRFGLFPAETAQ